MDLDSKVEIDSEKKIDSTSTGPGVASKLKKEGESQVPKETGAFILKFCPLFLLRQS
jgi:hypothetical protein